MNDAEFLHWLCDRLQHVYGESPNTDFMIRLRSIAWSTPEEQCSPCEN